MKASGIGRFVDKPVLKTLASGSVVSEFRLVFEERRKVKDKLVKRAHFFSFEIWDKAAEVVTKNFDKGDTIHIIQATPREDTWQDEDNKRHSKVYFRIDDFGFVPRPTKEADERWKSKIAENVPPVEEELSVKF